jgi:hypothetical protein
MLEATFSLGSISLMATPAQNALPAPEMMATRHSSSSPKVFQTSPISLTMSTVIELSFSGLFNVILEKSVKIAFSLSTTKLIHP